MFVIVRNDNRVWNYLGRRFDKFPVPRLHTYSSKYDAKRAAVRVESLQGSTGDSLVIISVKEWTEQTGGTW